MPTPADLEKYIEDHYGNAVALMVRDPESNVGWRIWNSEDSQALCQWLSANGETGHNGAAKPPASLCHNLEQAAQAAGVGIHTVQSWLRRKENALPHIKDGRRIIILHFMLVRWLKEEAERNTAGRT